MNLGRLFIFKELGSTGNYSKGVGVQSSFFWQFTEPCQKAKKYYFKENASISLDFKKESLTIGG